MPVGVKKMILSLIEKIIDFLDKGVVLEGFKGAIVLF